VRQTSHCKPTANVLSLHRAAPHGFIRLFCSTAVGVSQFTSSSREEMVVRQREFAFDMMDVSGRGAVDKVSVLSQNKQVPRG